MSAMLDEPARTAVPEPLVQPYELTILMPCLNEAETLERCIRKARSFLIRSGIHGEVVIADNGSTDGSQGIADAAGARVVPIQARGLWQCPDRRHRRGARALRHHRRLRRQLRFQLARWVRGETARRL